MPVVTQREAARRDLVEHYVYLVENASPDVAERFLINAEASFIDLARQPASLTWRGSPRWAHRSHLNILTWPPSANGASRVSTTIWSFTCRDLTALLSCACCTLQATGGSCWASRASTAADHREEAIKFVPAAADKGDHLSLKDTWTKGGKAREIPIRTDAQREVLNRAHQLAGRGSPACGRSSKHAGARVERRRPSIWHWALCGTS